MSSHKRNSIMAQLQSRFLHYSMSLCLETSLFANCRNSNVCIMVLRKLTFVVLVLHFFLPYHVDNDLRVLLLQCKTWVNAKLTGIFLHFSLLELFPKGSQSVLEAKCACSYIHHYWMVVTVWSPNVTEFWKITLKGVPETIWIFEFTTICWHHRNPF